MTSANTQFEYMSVPPFMIALFDMGPQVVPLAHHVSVPDCSPEFGRFHLAGFEEVQPLHPTYVVPAGTSSTT